MKKPLLKQATIAGLLLASSTIAMAGGKLEKVDIVKEGIDLEPAIVRANSNGYTSYENSNHRYLVRLYAKANGNNAVWWVSLGTIPSNPFEVSPPSFFDQKVRDSEGWGVYSKSLSFYAGFAHTRWLDSPKDACESNLERQVADGMRRANVLEREWNVTARAMFFFSAQADSKSHNKKNKHKIDTGNGGSKSVSYPINVVCRAAL